MSKTSINTLFALLIISCLLISCNKDDPNDIETPSSFTKKVVVEKYTGEWCGACVDSGKFYDENVNNRQFIGVGIHAGNNLSPDRYKDNPACLEMGPYLFEVLGGVSVGVEYFPNVLFDRTANSLGKIINGLTEPGWRDRLDEAEEEEAICGLSIASTISGSNLTGTIRYAISQVPSQELAITVYLIEDDLDGSLQADAGPDYRHNNVLRGLMTPKEGKTIGPLTTNQILEFDFTAIDISEFEAQNLEVVAFIHETGPNLLDRKILNGQKVKAGSTQDFD